MRNLSNIMCVFQIHEQIMNILFMNIIVLLLYLTKVLSEKNSPAHGICMQ